ncbi:MAG TPA: hypothetical protein ENJ91_03210 [Rhodobacteraceae bacterium]|nr:hypothetical protein [Paracoccaceae bacterium]
MTGWKIFTHSLKMVFGNIDAALRISLVLYLAQQAVGIYFAGKYGQTLKMMEQNMLVIPPSGFWPTLFVMLLVSLVTSLWIAISWHRYVLLEENPRTFIPPVSGERLLAYFGKTVILMLIMIAIGAVVGFVVSLLGFAIGPQALEVIVPLILIGTMLYFSYRIGLVFPAVALDKPIGFRESWEITRSAAGAVFQLSVIAIGFAILIRLPGNMAPDSMSVIDMVYSAVMGWIAMMVGVSVLTTLYGVYEEGREL